MALRIQLHGYRHIFMIIWAKTAPSKDISSFTSGMSKLSA